MSVQTVTTNNVRVPSPAGVEQIRAMDSDSLGRYVAEETAGVLHRLADLRPFYEELWRRFGKLQKGETIMGCRNRAEYATKVLGRSMRSIQYALYGRRPLHSKAESLAEGFLPSEWVKDDAKALRRLINAQREADANDPEFQDSLRKVAEKRSAAAPAPEPNFFLNVLPGKCPPAADIREFASLGRQAAARKYHPDHGGNEERMAALNCVADWLECLAA